MLQADFLSPDTLNQASSFFFPFTAVLLACLLIWLLQSWLASRVYRRLIYPEVKRSRLFYYLIGWAAVAIHEIGHALVGAVTGAKIQEIEITGTHGQVKSLTEVSLVGWLSLALSSLAPTFLPPLLFLAAFSLAFPGILVLDYSSFESIAFSNASNIASIAFSLSDLFNPFSLLLLYFLVILSPTAGPSLGDVRNVVLQAIHRPFAMLVLFLVLAVVFYTFDYLGFPFANPIIWAVSLSFLTVLLGLFLASLLAFFLRRARSISFLSLAFCLLSFIAVYSAARLSLLPELAIFSEPPKALAFAGLLEVLFLLLLPKGERQSLRQAKGL